jgi:streptomycin 6-kinase
LSGGWLGSIGGEGVEDAAAKGDLWVPSEAPATVSVGLAMALVIPNRLSASCRQTQERSAWLAGLPAGVREVERRWSLTVGRPFDGDEVSCAWVAPVTLADGTRAVLKMGMPHFEAEHEIAGLSFWNGDPTVQLIAADENLGAMLIERCDPGTHLRAVHSEVEQDEVIARLLRRIWRSPVAPHVFRPLSVLTEYWSAEALEHSAEWPDAGLTREGLSLFSELPRTASRNLLLATDLHAGNVLKARREPWLVIDPKPFVGDPAFDATQHLLNCAERLRTESVGTIRRFAELLEVDHERVRLWTFARIAAEPRDDWRQDALSEVARAIAP